jgi:hypothetical protein
VRIERDLLGRVVDVVAGLRGIGRTAFAKAAGVNAGTLSSSISGQFCPGVDFECRVCDALGLPTDPATRGLLFQPGPATDALIRKFIFQVAAGPMITAAQRELLAVATIQRIHSSAEGAA